MPLRSPVRRLAVLAAAAAAAATVVVPAPAGAATGLAPVARLYAGSLLMQSPVVAMDGASRATVMWLDFNAQQLSARSYANGTWSAVEPVPRGLGTPGDYRLVMDRAGNATALWKTSTGVESARKPAGGTWEAVEFVSEPGVTVHGYDAAAGADGTITVAWSAGPERRLRLATRAAAGSWAPAAPDGRTGVDPEISVDVDASGASAVLYGRTDATRTVEVAERPAGGAWTVAMTRERPATVGDWFARPQVAAGDGGDVVGAWEEKPDGTATRLASVVRAPGGEFAGPLELSSADREPGRPSVAVLADGQAVALWRDGTEKLFQTTRRARGDGGWSAPVTTGGAGATAAVLGEDGRRVHLDVFDGTAGGSPKWSMLEDGTFGAFKAVDPSQTGMEAAMAFDGQGNGMLAWLRLGRTETGEVSGFDVVARAIDGTAPDITALVTPERAAAGAPATFAVEATDKFSSGAAAWDFGDGTGVAGSTATHAYAAPGRYSGTVLVADEHGNAVRRPFTVEVTGAAGAGVAGGTPITTVQGAQPVVARPRDRRRPRVRLSGVASRLRSSWLLRRPRVTVRTDEPASILVEVRIGRRLIARGATAGRRSMRVTLRPTVAGTAQLRRLRASTRATVRVRATDLAGNRRTVSRTVRLQP